MINFRKYILISSKNKKNQHQIYFSNLFITKCIQISIYPRVHFIPRSARVESYRARRTVQRRIKKNYLPQLFLNRNHKMRYNHDQSCHLVNSLYLELDTLPLTIQNKALYGLISGYYTKCIT